MGSFNKKALLGNCLGAVVLTIVLLILLMLFLDIYTHHNNEIEVPDLSKKSYAVVSEQLSEKGLYVVVQDTGYVRNLPADVVLGQSVAPGQKVKEGRVIYVTINAAEASAVPVPDVANNSSYRQAESKLAVLGFKLTAPKYITGDKDWVYGVEARGRSVAAGEKVSIDIPLTLVVGDGFNQDDYNEDSELDFFVDDEEDRVSSTDNDFFIDEAEQ